MYHTGIHVDDHSMSTVYHRDGRKVFTGTRAECAEFRALLKA